ncbi:hypothetical protein DC366_10365 [Pelagivirga sediminicola]|uniref:DUF3718 domain-containing protein n=2 Tax=Pelagivirga sediminicola TaxID=2170575 RepID=A0A2T7G709_9RHOB|nr:hypothetical protein DC366_10365 [Pelagivirga sediminicola]
MKTLASLALAALVAGPAGAACIAEYKAKRDDPLKLFYGTAEIAGACTLAAARAQLEAQLASEGLTLLKVLSVRQE